MSVPATPHNPTSGRASVPPTRTHTPLPSHSTQPPQPTLPPPSSFDILPDLHKLLSRLIQTSQAPAAPTPSQADDTGPLEIQQLGAAAIKVRRKIQRARDAVVMLPDVERSVEDQEEEIEELEGRIRELRGLLGGLGKREGDVEMGG